LAISSRIGHTMRSWPMSTSNGIGYWRVKDAGELEATNIVIVGDHGESLDDHGEQAHGVTLYESVSRVPLIVVSSVQANRGLRVKGPVSSVDLCPTLLDCQVEKS
jgi:arylsulfatase A-like enzyme